MMSSSALPPARSESCPGAESLAALALGEGEPDARRELADHVVTCPACAADFRLLRELHRETSRTQRGFLRSRRTWIAAGIAAVLAGVVLAPLLVRDNGDTVRGPGTSVEPPDGALLNAPPQELAWPAEPGSRGYRVKLMRGDATPVWESDVVRVPAVTLPAEIRSGMRREGSWYWTVESIGPVQRRRMGPFWFQVRPDGG